MQLLEMAACLRGVTALSHKRRAVRHGTSLVKRKVKLGRMMISALPSGQARFEFPGTDHRWGEAKCKARRKQEYNS